MGWNEIKKGHGEQWFLKASEISSSNEQECLARDKWAEPPVKPATDVSLIFIPDISSIGTGRMAAKELLDWLLPPWYRKNKDPQENPGSCNLKAVSRG